MLQQSKHNNLFAVFATPQPINIECAEQMRAFKRHRTTLVKAGMFCLYIAHTQAYNFAMAVYGAPSLDRSKTPSFTGCAYFCCNAA